MKNTGKHRIIVVIISTIIFMVLQNHNFSSDHSGNPVIMNVFRVFLFAPLLYFLYKRHNWSRVLLGALCALVSVMGIIALPLFLGHVGLTSIDLAVLVIMFSCMIINVSVLFFSPGVKQYMKRIIISEEA